MDFKDKNYEDLLKACLCDGTLFEDDDFPATNDSIDPTGEYIPDGLEWKRPTEICCDEPRFVTEGFSRFDVRQGDLGDCWLLAAMSTLTFNDGAFERVVKKANTEFDSEQYAGIFTFKLWFEGRWVNIVVDDYLPTVGGQLIYSRSTQQNEFWPALLEKAYAKLYGHYRAIEGGMALDALIDFTGGVGENFKLQGFEEDEVFDILTRAQSKRSFMTASTPDGTETEDGLPFEHAYSITGVEKAVNVSGEEVRLVRIRNPWGNETEWEKAWSDKSAEWDSIAEGERERLQHESAENGEFYISAADFVARFESFDICHFMFGQICADSGAEYKWNRGRIEGRWIEGFNAGGRSADDMEGFATNPQFKIVFSDSDEGIALRMRITSALASLTFYRRGPEEANVKKNSPTSIK